MSSIIKVETTEKDGHKDLKFTVVGLVERTFDTYYFAIAIEPFEVHQDIRNCISNFINLWIAEVQSMQYGQTKYLPIDISDQYIGCLKVAKIENGLELSYGFTQRGGWSLSILNPADFFDSVDDFEQTESVTIRVEQQQFINSINEQVSKLRNLSFN